MSPTSPPLTFLLLTITLLFLFLQLHRAPNTPDQWARTVQTLSPTPTALPIHVPPSLFLDAVHHFCHTDPGLDIRAFPALHISPRNCIGQCEHRDPQRATFLPHALETPRITTLCLNNPFHGFYDCIWPLIHYLTTCLPLQSFNDTPPILINNRVLSEERQHKWVVRAQERYLYNSRPPETLIEKNRVAAGRCLCFSFMVKFKRSAFWRPTRFQYIQELGHNTVAASHPNGAKRNGLREFRRIVLESVGLDSKARRPKRVLVYGREDAKRRKWLNAGEFVRVLRMEVGGDVTVVHSRKPKKTFVDQVVQYNGAGLVVAPHGAAMANTMFMRENSGVLEIASKNCFSVEERETARKVMDMDVVENVSDANAWVPWHAQSLGLYHMSAACFMRKEGDSGLETDNESLVKLAVIMLMLSKKTEKR